MGQARTRKDPDLSVKPRPEPASFGTEYLKEIEMRILSVLGVLFIVAWLVMLLALKITFAAIHALVVIGLVLLVVAFMSGRAAGAKS